MGETETNEEIHNIDELTLSMMNPVPEPRSPTEHSTMGSSKHLIPS